MKTHVDGVHTSDDTYSSEEDGSSGDDAEDKKPKAKTIVKKRKATGTGTGTNTTKAKTQPAAKQKGTGETVTQGGLGDFRRMTRAMAKEEENLTPPAVAAVSNLHAEDEEDDEEDGKPPAKKAMTEKHEASLEVNRQKSMVVQKLEAREKAGALPSQVLADLVDSGCLAAKWIEVKTTDGKSHHCVMVKQGDYILKLWETAAKIEGGYNIPAGQTRETLFRNKCVDELQFEVVAEHKATFITAEGTDWWMIMFHPDFRPGTGNKVDRTALEKVRNDKSAIARGYKKKRALLDWNVKDEWKVDKRKTVKKTLWLAKSIGIHLGSFPVDNEGSNDSTLGNKLLEKATEELEKRRERNECIAKETMIAVLDEKKYRRVQVSTQQIHKMRNEAEKAGHLPNYETSTKKKKKKGKGHCNYPGCTRALFARGKCYKHDTELKRQQGK